MRMTIDTIEHRNPDVPQTSPKIYVRTFKLERGVPHETFTLVTEGDPGHSKRVLKILSGKFVWLTVRSLNDDGQYFLFEIQVSASELPDFIRSVADLFSEV